MKDDQCCGKCIHYYPNPNTPDQGQCRGGLPQLVIAEHREGTAPAIGSDGKVGQQQVHQYKYMVAFPGMMANDPGCAQFEEDI